MYVMSVLHTWFGRVIARLRRELSRTVAQQIWIDLVPFARDARSWLGIDRLQAHLLHQSPHALVIDLIALTT